MKFLTMVRNRIADMLRISHCTTIISHTEIRRLISHQETTKGAAIAAPFS